MKEQVTAGGRVLRGEEKTSFLGSALNGKSSFYPPSAQVGSSRIPRCCPDCRLPTADAAFTRVVIGFSLLAMKSAMNSFTRVFVQHCFM